MKIILWHRVILLLLNAALIWACSDNHKHKNNDTDSESSEDTETFDSSDTWVYDSATNETSDTHTGNDVSTDDSVTGSDIDTASNPDSASNDSDIVDTESENSDTGCIPGTLGCACDAVEICDAGFSCILGTCMKAESCTPGEVNSIAGVCKDNFRICKAEVTGFTCGDCVADAEEVNGVCVLPNICGDVECGANEYCVRLSAGSAQCTPRPCADRIQAENTSGQCITCDRSCVVPGGTGNIWPYTDLGDTCICETIDGYFTKNGGDAVPEKCDADGDGWVRDDVVSSVFSVDNALAANMRCNVRYIDRVMLEDEYGISQTIRSCKKEGLVKDTGETTVCTEPLPIPLVETKRNDVDGELVKYPDHAPAYGGEAGRFLHANELNALTKGCMTNLADYNDDKKEDINEVQVMVENAESFSPELRLKSFTYFMELYKSEYQLPLSGEYGSLKITERSRCDINDFPLHYGDNRPFNTTDEETYWRNCYRRRDPAFEIQREQKSGTPGFDFAQWSPCSGENDDPNSGSCIAAPPAHRDEDATYWDVNKQLLRRHGLCELEGYLPKDGIWRGMHHHSQFRCVSVTEETPAADSSERHISDFTGGNSAKLVLNKCRAKVCTEEDAECEESDVPYDDETQRPIIECDAGPDFAKSGEVGFAANTYREYDAGPDGYAGGCIDEDSEWNYLCPPNEFDNVDDIDDNPFGRFSCWCTQPRFIWAPESIDDAPNQRAVLRWADENGSTENTSLWAPDDPLPDTDSENCPAL